MSITPPVISAFDLYFVPKTLPTFAPAMDMMQVVQPIMPAASAMSTSRNAKVMPAARASMLVATASMSMVLKDSEPLSLPGKGNGLPYYMMDLLQFSGLDLDHLDGPVRLEVNGEECGFRYVIKPRDCVTICYA